MCQRIALHGPAGCFAGELLHTPHMKTAGSALLPSVALLALLCQCAGPGLERYPGAVVADVPSAPTSGVRITYLGVNGYLLQSRDATVVVDPFFSRMPLRKYFLDRNVQPDAKRVAWGLQRLPAHVDLILVTHGHCDHLLDVPPIALKTGGRVIASPTSCNLVRSLKTVPEKQIAAILTQPNPTLATSQTMRFGTVTVQALFTEHDRICGMDIMPGRRDSPGEAPRRGTHWVCGEPLAFVVTMAGKRIFISSGMVHAPRQEIAPVDLAILGVALPDPRRCLSETVQILKPRYVLPSHQDNFFIGPEKGFRFARNADFDAVRKALPDGKLGENLILLDYFRPWTLN